MQGRAGYPHFTIALGKQISAFGILVSSVFISFSLVACSNYQLRDPTDLNARLIPFSKVDGTVAGCKYADNVTSCEMTGEIALAPPHRLEVTELVIEPKVHNKVLPGISYWQWDIPSSDRKLESLSRSDLLALNFFRLASVPADLDRVCENPDHSAEQCTQEDVVGWWDQVKVTPNTKVETVFAQPTLTLHIVNGVRVVSEPEAPLTVNRLCAGISQSAGAPWNVSSEADTDASRTHSIQFYATGANPRKFYVFKGSNWIFSGDLHEVPKEFDNGWLNTPTGGPRYYSRSNVSVTIPVENRGLPINDHLPLCTTIEDVATQLYERGYVLTAVSRECKALPGDFLHIQRNKGSVAGRTTYETLDLHDRERAKELALVCPPPSKRLMLRFFSSHKNAVKTGVINLPPIVR